MLTKHLSLIPISILLISNVFAQSTANTNGCKPPITRQLRHEIIDKEQKNALKVDGKADETFTMGDNDEINLMVTQAITRKIDLLQCAIETDTLIDHRMKVAYLDGISTILKAFNKEYKKGKFNASNLPLIISTFQAAINSNKVGASIEPLIQKNNYEVGNMVISSGAFADNAGYKASKNILILKYSQLYPDKILYTLNKNQDVPFFDSLILVAAYKYPRLLYDYASANNKFGTAIRKIEDPLVQTITKMARSGGSGQLYFPFLDNILKGNQTFEEIDKVKNDDVKYYKLLVKTRLDYVNRMLQKETVLESKGLAAMIEKKAKDVFIRQINALHNDPDPIRFRILQSLNAPELYYLAIAGESEIYTSSYVRGVYPLMMSRIGNRGDSLMMVVGFDRFKKFIKMAAGYNTLNHFLKSFPDVKQAESLMTAFVNGLEKSDGLEDGVDVADSYVSISEGNKPLAASILHLVKENYDRNVAQNNRRGMVMYNLLYKLFLSADSTNNINLSQEFGIPPVYNVSYDALANDSGSVVMQVFFYGDKDGQTIFPGFLRLFSNSNWNITLSKLWVRIASTKGKPILIYANRPLPEETDEDEKARAALMDHLIEKNLEPTIVIHRGHSYYAPYTIKYIQPSAKIVFLGSCGGYHLIHDVLTHAPDAHIIASKQVGMTAINQPFLNLINEKLRTGNNIDWIPFWNEFRRAVGPRQEFEDYIPPHKNLGAIFIKAYKTQMGDSGEALTLK